MFSSKFFPRAACSLLLAVVLISLVPLPEARANMAEPPKSGHPAGEPLGTKGVFIKRETLTIDVRPLAEIRDFKDPQTILVEAVYEVENPGGEKTLDLWFALGSKQKEFQVWLDDRELTPIGATVNAKLPDGWQVPQKTPAIDDKGGDLHYFVLPQDSPAPMAFSATLGAGGGAHRFKIRYKAVATRNIFGSPTVYWQFAYILAPARQWAGFGGLDLKVIAPPDWKLATNLKLSGGGGVYSGRFNEIPADAFTLTAQAPTPPLYVFTRFFSVTLFLVILFGFPLAILVWYWRKRFRQPMNWIWAILLSLLWSIAIFMSGIWAIFAGKDAISPGQYAPEYGYGSAFLLILVFALAVCSLPLAPSVWLNIIAGARKAKAVKS